MSRRRVRSPEYRARRIQRQANRHVFIDEHEQDLYARDLDATECALNTEVSGERGNASGTS
jgi:hypothetical protein